jgi:hypothetical protein
MALDNTPASLLEVEHYRVIPFSEITPSNCAIIAGRGEVALVKLRSWGLDPAVTGSLSEAVRRLHRVSRAKSYGADITELRLTLNSIHICADFYQIAASLGEHPIGPAIPELAIALQGGLTGTNSARRAREYLSQYWVGTLLTLANIEPRVVPPEPDKPRPDFLIDLGGLDCAVEVKRPESFHSARRALDQAAGQLRSLSQPGVICMDISDCLCDESFATAFIQSSAPIGQAVFPLFERETAKLSERPEKYNQSDKYKRILALVLFARATGWRGVDPPRAEGKYFLQLPTYEAACGGLVVDFVGRLKRIFITGFERMSGSPSER